MRKVMFAILTTALVLVGLAGPATARPTGPASPPPRPAVTGDRPHVQQKPLRASERPPISSPNKPPTQKKSRAAAACSPGDIISKTGSALVAAIKAADPEDCLYPLFSLTGSDAGRAFRESQMLTVANAYRDNAASYPGDNSTSTLQLVLYLRAGYYVQSYHPGDVGTYGSALKAASEAAMDAFFGNGRAWTVNEDNGRVLSESVTLITNATENARYLWVVKRLLTSYTTSYGYYMENAVFNGFNVVFLGHWAPGFIDAVQRDPSVLTTLHDFARNHLNLLGTDKGYLVGDAGLELGRFVQYGALQATVRPQMRDLLNASSITGPTAVLWVAVGQMADSYDQANCSYYGTCDFKNRLMAAALPLNQSCSSTLKIRAQQLTSAEFGDACTSLLNQNAYFHNLVQDPGPVAGDNNTNMEVVAFHTKADYSTYAGAIFGVDTNNGGIYLEGDPSKPGNLPRFIAYQEAAHDFPAQIRNLNHEYTHYLDGRYDMAGDFQAGQATPQVWWIEGFAEYVSYSYRRISDQQAISEAARHTYSLSTLFDTTYENSDQTRIYPWGYLAVRYMFEKHRNDLSTLLGYYRAGNWNGARSFVKGLNYNADFTTWLTACANGACGGSGGTNQAPVPSFTSSVSGLAVSLKDTSTDPDGTIASRLWDFGDGTSSTAASPTKTYGSAGTYTVKLTVTDDKGASASTTRSVTVGSGGIPECTGSDIRALGQNCKRSNLSAGQGDYAYLYINVPAGTTRLTISSSGGTGDADLYYNASTWATTSSFSQRATGAGNTHTLTVNNPPAGTNFISLYGTAAFSSATVSTGY